MKHPPNENDEYLALRELWKEFEEGKSYLFNSNTLAQGDFFTLRSRLIQAWEAGVEAGKRVSTIC
jgi:hypothetical protein